MTRPSSALPLRARRAAASAGYTLVEIMLVLSIIMVLLGMGIYYMGGIGTQGKVVAAQGSVTALSTALKSYEMTALTLPSTEQGLMVLFQKPDSEPRPDRWVQQVTDTKAFRDPWGHPYQYRYPGKKNPKSFDVFSMGEDGVESDDDIGNWSSTSK